MGWSGGKYHHRSIWIAWSSDHRISGTTVLFRGSEEEADDRCVVHPPSTGYSPPAMVSPCWIWSVPFYPLRYGQVVDLVDHLIADGRPTYFITANLNYVMISTPNQGPRGRQPPRRLRSRRRHHSYLGLPLEGCPTTGTRDWVRPHLRALRVGSPSWSPRLPARSWPLGRRGGRTQLDRLVSGPVHRRSRIAAFPQT